MDAFEKVSEQPEAKRLLRAALDDGLAHAYLFHGPPGVGKRALATAFAAELLGDARRVERGSHPDLYALEPLGDQIRIDAIRALRHDLHMRPFEADYRVYLIFGAHAMNEEAADALLKDLEEPPAYAVIVLVADELGSLPETIRSRCQLVPFRRLSERTVREAIAAQAPELPADEAHGLLTAVKGIGPWTADIYLLFCLGHPDAFPAGDLALQDASPQAGSTARRCCSTTPPRSAASSGCGWLARPTSRPSSTPPQRRKSLSRARARVRSRRAKPPRAASRGSS